MSEFAIGFCHSKKMYNVTIIFVIGPMSDQNYFCSDICKNLVGHCPMSDSNLQPRQVFIYNSLGGGGRAFQ
jgi:hypothetical protein